MTALLVWLRVWFWRAIGKKRRAGGILAALTRKQNKASRFVERDAATHGTAVVIEPMERA